MNQPLRQRQPRMIDDPYLVAIRLLPCCVCGMTGPSDAAHIRMSGVGWGVWGEGKEYTGGAEKPSDNYAVPLCKPRYKPDPVARAMDPDKKVKLVAVGCHGQQHGHDAKKLRELTDDPEIKLKLEEAFWRATGKNPFMIAAMLYEKFGTGLKPRRKRASRAKREAKAVGFEPSKNTLKAMGATLVRPKQKIASRPFQKTQRKIPARKK
jgi:hypothetical protein